MRRATSVVATIIFVVGFVWQYGKWFLDWVGRALAMRDLNHGFDLFRQSVFDWIAQNTEVGSQIGPWVLMGAGLISLAALHLLPALQRRLRIQAIEFVFPNECNLEHKVGHPFKRSSSPLFSAGKSSEARQSVHEFFLGVYNPNPKKTLRNVRVFIECSQYGSMFEKYLLCERSGNDSTDIAPHMTDYFLIGKGIDDSDAGLFHPVINPPPEYMTFLLQFEQNHAGFVIFGKGSHTVLLKNDGIPLHRYCFCR